MNRDFKPWQIVVTTWDRQGKWNSTIGGAAATQRDAVRIANEFRRDSERDGLTVEISIKDTRTEDI